jgi:type I restriction enzyme S subunit
MRVKIGDFLKPVRSSTTIQSDVDYKQVTVRMNNQGVCLRGIKKGSEIKTKKQFLVEPGQFILSKIDARNGAFGLVPEDLAGAIVTQDFPTYSINQQIIDKDYLVLMSSSGFFVDLMRQSSSGTTNRKRLKEEKFLNIEIELPTLKEQKEISQKNRILLGFSSKIDKKLLSQIKIIDKLKTDSFELATTDKIENYKNNSYQKDEILRSGLKIKKNCQWIKLGEICQVTSSKRIHVEDYTSEGIPFYRSKEIGSLSKGLDIRSNHYISENKFNEIKNQFGAPLKGDLLLTSVGSIGNCWISDGRDFYYKDGNVTLLRPSSKLSVEYLELFINSNLFKKQVLAKISGTAYNALTIVKIKSLLIPYVEIEEQVRLVSRLKSEVSIFDQILHEALLAKERIANIVERNYEPKHN